MLPTKFRFIKRFQRRRFLEINQSETRIVRKHLWKVLCKDCSFRPDPLTNMAATGHSCFWLIDFLKIRNKNCLWWPCLLMDRDKISNLYKGPSIDARLVDFSKIFSSETPWPNESKLCRKHPWKVIYKDCAFSSVMFVNGSGRNEQYL
jgi:hypothetical protein